MPQVVSKSIHRITFGGVRLLDIGDYLLGDSENLVRIAPEFPGLEAVSYPGGKSRMFERQGPVGRFYNVSFTVLRLLASTEAATADGIRRLADLPAGGQDLAIQISTMGGSAILWKAAITSAEHHTIDRLSVFTIAIKGGQMTASLSSSPSGDADIQAEDGTDFQAQDGNTLQEG